MLGNPFSLYKYGLNLFDQQFSKIFENVVMRLIVLYDVTSVGSFPAFGIIIIVVFFFLIWAANIQW